MQFYIKKLNLVGILIILAILVKSSTGKVIVHVTCTGSDLRYSKLGPSSTVLASAVSLSTRKSTLTIGVVGIELKCALVYVANLFTPYWMFIYIIYRLTNY